MRRRIDLAKPQPPLGAKFCPVQSLEVQPFNNIFVFRHSPVDFSDLPDVASSLTNQTTYYRPAQREQAPAITDCLTAIHYVFKKALRVDIPLTYIGDMPRQLTAYGEWRPLSIPREEARCGDLLFVKNKEKPKLISHVALFLDANSVFHCNASDRTAVIQDYEEFSNHYEQALSFRQAVYYIDPRNKCQRLQEQGDLIKK